MGGDTPVQEVGVGLGTSLFLVLAVSVAFVLVIVYLGRRARRKKKRARPSGLGSTTELRSVLSTPPGKRSNTFCLPTKHCNVHKNDETQNVRLQQVVNPSASVNEFVAEPEVYDLGPTPSRRSKRVKTPESPLFKKGESFPLEEFEIDTLEREKKAARDENHSESSMSVVVEVEIEDPMACDGKEDRAPCEETAPTFVHLDKPSRSSPSPVYDSFEAKPEIVENPYVIGPKPTRKSKRMKSPPKSPLLNGEPFTLDGFQMAMPEEREEGSESSSSVAVDDLEVAVATTGCEEGKELALTLPEKPSRSCLSSSSDSSQGKPRRKLSVTFDSAVKLTESVEDLAPPPPPLPPRHGEPVDNSCEGITCMYKMCVTVSLKV